MYKIIAIDLDGTLLNSYGEITPRTKSALHEAIKRGVQVVLASRKANQCYREYCCRNRR